MLLTLKGKRPQPIARAEVRPVALYVLEPVPLIQPAPGLPLLCGHVGIIRRECIHVVVWRHKRTRHVRLIDALLDPCLRGVEGSERDRLRHIRYIPGPYPARAHLP